MKTYFRYLLVILFVGYLTPVTKTLATTSQGSTTLDNTQELTSETLVKSTDHQTHKAAINPDTPSRQVNLPPIWLALPFIFLLLMIATGPLLYERFWHQHYAKVAVGLAGFVMAYYIFRMHNLARPFEALMEYLQFMALISALYMAAGGILIKIRRHRYPAVINVGILLIGAILSNLIGTTGASMLLIRPYIRFNRDRSKVFHIIFFILIVSNIGGALTPIGDPPLFLGFLKGVPFLWTLQHNIQPWLLILSLLIVAFYVFDANRPEDDNPPAIPTDKPILTILGKRNFFWLMIIILAVFVDPHIFNWVPAISYDGHSFSFVREVILVSVAGLCYFCANKPALQGNEFSFAPLREVIFIFIGIFGTMLPALSLISTYAQSSAASALITPNSLYWGAGILSSVLDNAPTYLNFLAASMASQGADLANPVDVQAYAMGGVFAHSVLRLKAISIASVFFGAMTYIGNGPNFMVKSIAEHSGIPMPSFFGYTMRFAVPLLLPLLFVVWLIYFFFIYI
jgi:Na+/H+ antiporter NhaD/arsenite permease-like protein